MSNYQYFNLISYFVSVMVVIFLLIFLALALVKKRPTRKKLMSYECGFEPFTDARKPFYINFYNIGLIFLLFDVELMLLLPGVYSLAILTPEGLGWLFFFIFILMFGYFYELVTGALKILR
jgi:NADH-quinone oxidoreductase subunit A